MKNAMVMQSPIGLLTLVEEDGALAEIRFGKCVQDETIRQTPLLQRTMQELSEYFSGVRKTFSIPLRPSGTAFQHKCWDALLRIPYGETRTYAQQAQMIGNPKACRAVGMGNHLNPIPILIPCHRVVGKNGTLTGYAGGLSIKEKLLTLERMNHP